MKFSDGIRVRCQILRRNSFSLQNIAMEFGSVVKISDEIGFRRKILKRNYFSLLIPLQLLVFFVLLLLHLCLLLVVCCDQVVLLCYFTMLLSLICENFSVSVNISL